MREATSREFFDQAYFEGQTRQSPPHRRELIYPFALRTAGFLCRRYKPGTVLDVGCAKGYLAEAFHAHGVRKVCGMDISFYAVSQGESWSRGKLMVGDARSGIPLSTGSCDLVTALDLFEHLPEPGPVLEEIRRVLAQGGVAYLKICHPRHPNAHRDPSHVNVQQLSYWERLFAQFGFEWKRIFETDFTDSQGLLPSLKALVRRAREWAVIGTPADYKMILWKRHDR